MCGYHGKILFIDLSNGSSETVEPGEEWYRIHGGGGLLGAHLLLTRTRANIDPLSPENLLIFTSSVIAGNEAPGLARFSVIAKSPLTGGIAETRCEGAFGVRYLKASGYDAVVFAGKAEKPVSALIDDGTFRARTCRPPVGHRYAGQRRSVFTRSTRAPMSASPPSGRQARTSSVSPRS